MASTGRQWLSKQRGSENGWRVSVGLGGKSKWTGVTCCGVRHGSLCADCRVQRVPGFLHMSGVW
jgi:hypothetical protein